MTSEILKNKLPRTSFVESCPFCENKDTKLLFSSADRLHQIPGEFSYHRCSLCQTVFQNPMVIAEDLHLCYPQNYYTHNPIEDNQRLSVSDALKAAEKTKGLRKLRHNIRMATINNIKGVPTNGIIGRIGKILSSSSRLREKAFFDHVADEILPFSDGKLKALEIGCGAGQMLVNLRRVGWEVEGVEWNEKSAEAARRYSSAPVHSGDFLKLDLPKNTFHLILLHHVFEHLRDPKKAFQRFSELLVKGGRLVLVYPNPNSLGSHLYKVNWYPWEVPRHLIFASNKAINGSIDEFGMKIIKTKSRAKEAAMYSAISRMYKINQTVNLMHSIKKTNQDYLLEIIEKFCIAIGLNIGEEKIIVLKKI